MSTLIMWKFSVFLDCDNVTRSFISISYTSCIWLLKLQICWRATVSDTMSSSCYHIGTNRLSQDEYQVTNIDVVNKRSNKNLFKTALEKLNKRYKKHKKISDNLYEVIVIHKEKDDEDEPAVESLVPPTPPTRSRARERSCSRNSVWSNGTGTGTVPPTPPPRSRRNSQSSFGRNIPLNDTIPPTPPPRSRPQSRSSCRGTGKGTDHTHIRLSYILNIIEVVAPVPAISM